MIKFSNISNNIETESIVILLDKSLSLSPHVIAIDELYNGIITKSLSTFKGVFGEILPLTFMVDKGEKKTLILCGVEEKEEDKIDSLELKFERIGGKLYKYLSGAKIKDATIIIENSFAENKLEATAIATGIMLASYRFDKYKTKEEDKKNHFANCIIGLADYSKAEEIFERKKAMVEGVFLARNCVSEPPNNLYPESYANLIEEELKPLGIEIEILGEREMKNLGMGALLGVGQGSTRESKIVIMKYKPESSEDYLALVGKGVTFDTGGISLKPSNGMEDMKYDMAGSASVVGTMKAIALAKVKANVIGAVGLVENMPGGNAQRPSDVVKTYSGQTVEVLNTDAEGRLVLADVLSYIQDNFQVHGIIDLATLTGAMVVALGSLYAGVFANNDEFAERIQKVGSLVGENLWRFPLHKEYDKMLKSDIADFANISGGRGAGSITAAQFLQKFINKGKPWAHLDIAGVAWEKSGTDITPKGAVGYGVRLLYKLIVDYYEAK